MTGLNETTQNEKQEPSLSPADMVARMHATTGRLTEVVDLETHVIKDRRPLDILDLQAEKTRLANEYALDVQKASKDPHLIDSAPARDVAGLKTAIGRLRERLAVNAEALQAASTVSQGVIRVIADAVAEKQAPTVGYGKDAALERPAGQAPAALSLDKRI